MPAGTLTNYVLELPYPPSANRYWRRVGNRVLISAEGRRYREEVQKILTALVFPLLLGRLRVDVWAVMPDRRERDLDNVLKALLDALEYGGAFKRDSQVDQLQILRRPVVKGGSVIVKITELDEA